MKSHISAFLYHQITQNEITNSVALTELVEAIAIEDNISNGTSLYQLNVENLISLESISTTTSISSNYLNSNTNPLYGLYMYAYWRSPNGSGSNRASTQNREDMQFLSKSVDNYGHTIIMDEFGKTSGYDPTLTAEVIRVMNMWMATIQSLYDAVQLCDGEEDPGVDDVSYISPIDKAAAFWFGSLKGADETSMQGNGSLYAWAHRAKSNFVFTDVVFDVNSEMVLELNQLQTLLPTCWADPAEITVDPITGEEVDVALQMRRIVDDISRYMTVPLVQNLIHHAASIANSDEANAAPTVQSDKIDWVIVSLLYCCSF